MQALLTIFLEKELSLKIVHTDNTTARDNLLSDIV